LSEEVESGVATSTPHEHEVQEFRSLTEYDELMTKNLGDSGISQKIRDTRSRNLSDLKEREEGVNRSILNPDFRGLNVNEVLPAIECCQCANGSRDLCNVYQSLLRKANESIEDRRHVQCAIQHKVRPASKGPEYPKLDQLQKVPQPKLDQLQKVQQQKLDQLQKVQQQKLDPLQKVQSLYTMRCPVCNRLAEPRVREYNQQRPSDNDVREQQFNQLQTKRRQRAKKISASPVPLPTLSQRSLVI
jgi:hypothetical protein